MKTFEEIQQYFDNMSVEQLDMFYTEALTLVDNNSSPFIKEVVEYCFGSIDILPLQFNKLHWHYSTALRNKLVSPKLEEIQQNINKLNPEDKSKLSDGYHTFDELYDIRLAYNVALFNEWNSHKIDTGEVLMSYPPQRQYKPKVQVYKTKKLYSDSQVNIHKMIQGWFIVVAILPSGQISNYYKSEHWDLFDIPEVDKVLHPYDGHTTQDVINRLKQYKP